MTVNDLEKALTVFGVSCLIVDINFRYAVGAHNTSPSLSTNET